MYKKLETVIRSNEWVIDDTNEKISGLLTNVMFPWGIPVVRIQHASIYDNITSTVYHEINHHFPDDDYDWSFIEEASCPMIYDNKRKDNVIDERRRQDKRYAIFTDKKRKIRAKFNFVLESQTYRITQEDDNKKEIDIKITDMLTEDQAKVEFEKIVNKQRKNIEKNPNLKWKVLRMYDAFRKLIYKE